PQVIKEWRRKSCQKSNVANPGVIEKTSTFVAPSPNNSAGLTKEAVDLQEKIPEVNNEYDATIDFLPLILQLNRFP
ncbi:hypothetical protein MKX03_019583, partial [Papaver bracteatum]